MGVVIALVITVALATGMAVGAVTRNDALVWFCGPATVVAAACLVRLDA